MRNRVFSFFFLAMVGLTACGRAPESFVANGAYSRVQIESICADHPVGESFPAFDGCNTCSCRPYSNGEMGLACTQMACASFN